MIGNELYQDWPVTGIPEDVAVYPERDVFANAGDAGALPVVIPVYNAPDRPAHDLHQTLTSIATSSFETGQQVRPLLVVNGHEDGQALDAVRHLGLREGSQYIQLEGGGKVRALQAGVDLLLTREDYAGAFATTDDDVSVSRGWTAAVVSHMAGQERDAVSGGTIQYRQVPGVPRLLLAARNTGNTAKEWQASRHGELRAHGSNMWFSVTDEGIIARAVANLDQKLGYGDDAALVTSIKRMGGLVLPTVMDKAGRVLTDGNRTTTWRDLVGTLVGRGAARYADDESWQTQ